jgi:hypothetical protein
VHYPKNLNLWFPSYLRGRARRLVEVRRPKRLWVALTDHFEPCGNTTLENAHKRMDLWDARWPAIAALAPRDSAGRPPCFTFFYPQEEYQRDIVSRVAALTHDGTSDVEIHLHHFNDNAASFAEKIRVFKRQLHEEHGLLHHHKGQLVFGFIHGNWALDNSHPTGHGCGVTGELQLLRDLGCYADFTMPSAPSATQSRIVNQIYWTTGDPARPRGFDSGVQATVGGGTRGDLLMITGPVGLRLRERLLPRLEFGELAANDPPTPYRVERWLALAPRIGDDIFLKLYGHSAREDNARTLLGSSPADPGALASMFRWIHQAAARHSLELHWASAFEMFQAADRLIQQSPVILSEVRRQPDAAEGPATPTAEPTHLQALAHKSLPGRPSC